MAFTEDELAEMERHDEEVRQELAALEKRVEAAEVEAKRLRMRLKSAEQERDAARGIAEGRATLADQTITQRDRLHRERKQIRLIAAGGRYNADPAAALTEIVKLIDGQAAS